MTMMMMMMMVTLFIARLSCNAHTSLFVVLTVWSGIHFRLGKETPDQRMENDPEIKNSIVKHKHIGAVAPNEDIPDPAKFSNLRGLLRITNSCIRFLSNTRKEYV